MSPAFALKEWKRVQRQFHSVAFFSWKGLSLSLNPTLILQSRNWRENDRLGVKERFIVLTKSPTMSNTAISFMPWSVVSEQACALGQPMTAYLFILIYFCIAYVWGLHQLVFRIYSLLVYNAYSWLSLFRGSLLIGFRGPDGVPGVKPGSAV